MYLSPCAVTPELYLKRHRHLRVDAHLDHQVIPIAVPVYMLGGTHDRLSGPRHRRRGEDAQDRDVDLGREHDEEIRFQRRERRRAEEDPPSAGGRRGEAREGDEFGLNWADEEDAGRGLSLWERAAGGDVLEVGRGGQSRDDRRKCGGRMGEEMREEGDENGDENGVPHRWRQNGTW